MPTLDSADLAAIAALIAAGKVSTDGKLDTVTSSLTSIAGVVNSNNTLINAIPTTYNGSTSIVLPEDSVAPWDPRIDVPYLAAEWDFSDIATIYRTATVQAKVGDTVDRVFDRVNGWPAILNGVGAVAPVVAANGITFGGSASLSRLRVTNSAALSLIRNVPYAYIFVVASPATATGVSQQFVYISSNDSVKSRISLYSNNSGRGNFDSIRLDSDAQTGVFTPMTGVANGAKKIWFGAAEFGSGSRNVLVNNTNAPTSNQTYPSGAGNCSDTEAALFLIGGRGNTSVASGSLDGPLHHILLIVPPAALTSSEITSIYAALAAKWGVS